jgi:hypothetical protein
MAGARESHAYLLGAVRDGTFNQFHRTIRISQKEVRWLELLQKLIAKVGSRSWIDLEGDRDVWVVESTYRLEQPARFQTEDERVAFIRGYFDAEGGVPTRAWDRFYIQFVQKDREDLNRVKDFLTELGLKVGLIHNPSEKVDPNYWRLYVRASSQRAFIELVRSWHPRKRQLLYARLGQSFNK